VYWNGGFIGEVSLPISIRRLSRRLREPESPRPGRPFLFFTDEIGSSGSVAATACAANLPPWGFVRLIDNSDELHPRITAKLMLEVHDLANCPVEKFGIPSIVPYGYNAHHCGLDNANKLTCWRCRIRQLGSLPFFRSCASWDSRCRYGSPGGGPPMVVYGESSAMVCLASSLFHPMCTPPSLAHSLTRIRLVATSL
jgi:hypothetical protein